jgi:hypothetical protein
MFLGALGGAFLILLHMVLMTISSDMFIYSPFGKLWDFSLSGLKQLGYVATSGVLSLQRLVFLLL